MNNMTDNKKMMRGILIALIICVILVFVLIGVMLLVKEKPEKDDSFKFFLNNEIAEYPQDLFIFEENQVYVSLQDISRLLKVNFYYGEYSEGQGNEDKDKCYVINDYEVCTFYQNSLRIYKKRLNSIEWEYYDMAKEIKNINNKLYITLEGLNTAFNVTATYDVKEVYISIYTLDYLYEFYKAQATEFAFDELSPEYENKQALLRDMLIVIKSGKYGVMSIDGTSIIGYKYDKLLYTESTRDFLATIANKVGILSETGQAKIKIEYDSIKLMDKTLRLWLVQTSKRYGVLDRNGAVIMYQEYDSIGIDTTKYPPDKTHNGMILFDNAIPFNKYGKWGLYDKNGKQILYPEYDGFGCVVNNSSSRVDSNLLTIPEVDGIVICKNGLYGVVDAKGTTMIPCDYEKIYKTINLGQIEYYVELNGQATKLEITDKGKV